MTLDNIRCFDNCEINFSKGITLITGPNNSGKSTILKSIYKIQESNAILNTDIRSSEYVGQIAIEINEINKKDIKLFQNEKHVSIKNSRAILKFKIYEKSGDNKIIVDGTDKITLDKVNDFNNLDVENSEFLGLPKTEDKNNFIYPYFSKRKTNYFTSHGGKESTFSVLDTLQNLPAKVQKVMSQTFSSDKFNELCQDILGFRIGIISGENSDMRLGIYSSHNETIPIESMGDGVSNILGIIVTLLSENGKLFLIEEIENDIHPEALKKILDLILIKSNHNQFVISTHSNIVLKYLASIESTKIIFTKSEVIGTSDSYMPIATLQEISNSTSERIKVLEMLGYDLFDFDLYSAFLILEESSAERIIREILIPFFALRLNSKLRTIAAKGTSDVIPKFNDLHRLFLYVHTSEVYAGKAWVIVDGEESGLDIINRLKSTFSSWDSSHFMNFEEDNFEKYYPVFFQHEINEVCSMSSGNKRQDKKRELLLKVLKWSFEDIDRAKFEFSKSAKEVIYKLKYIEQKLF